MAEKNKARESVNNADSENMKAKTSGIQNTSEGAASEKGRAEAPKKGSAAAPKKSSKAVQPSNKQKTLDAMKKADADSKKKKASGKGDQELSEEELKKLKGVGGRQMRGVKVKVDNAPQMLQIMTLLQRSHLEPKRFQLVFPKEDKPANLVLIEAVKDAKPTLHPMPPIIVYTPENRLTNRLKSVYHII